MRISYGNFILEIALVAVLTSVIASTLSWFLGLFSNLGILSGIITALVLAWVFIYSLKTHPGTESFLEVIPIVLISASLVELLRNWITIIPSLITEFSWTSLAILTSAIFLSDTIVRKNILK